METLASIIASVSLLVCLTTVFFACSACKRIFRNKKKEKSKDEESANHEDNKKAENGFSNPAYEPARVKPTGTKEHDVTTSHDETTTECGNGKADHEGENKEIATPSDNNHEGEKFSTSAISDKNENTETNEDLPGPQSVDVDETNSISGLKAQEEILAENTTTADLSRTFGVNQETVNQGNKKDSLGNGGDGKSNNARPQRLDSLVILDDENMKDEWKKYEGMSIKGGWRLDVKLTDLLQLGLIDCETANQILAEDGNAEGTNSKVNELLKPYLEGENPIAGVLVSESGEKKSIFKSAKEGILRRGTAISLLEAQAATGSVIDPLNGRKMSVAEGFQLGLLDKVYETVLSRAERAVNGYTSRITNETMPIGQAMERGLVIESHGLRLLEAQMATGGIIDNKVNIKLPIELALRRKLVSEKVARRLAPTCEDVDDDGKADDLKTFFDPNTEENVTYRELMRRSVVDDDTGMRLYPLVKIGRKRYSHSSFSGRSSLVSSRAGSKESIPGAVASE